MKRTYSKTSRLPRRRFALWPKLLALLLSTLLGILILEIGLRIHNPFDLRVKHQRIVLPSHRTYTLKLEGSAKRDAQVIHHKNRLGFRGSEPPADLSKVLSLITVGGSTTECFFLSDDRTWPARLEAILKPSIPSLWVNNAGLDGHSTVGHLVLMKDCVAALRPKVVLFLVGLNDSALKQAQGFESQHIQGRIDLDSPKRFLKSWALRSEIMAVLENVVRASRAASAGLTHKEIDFSQIQLKHVPAEEKEKALREHREVGIGPYEKRLLDLIDLCRENAIDPVLITQPALLGHSFIQRTGETERSMDLSGTDFELQWEVIQLYNEATTRVAFQEGVFLIHLADEMPKDEMYYYDWYHVTNQGAEKEAEILSQFLLPFLKDRFPEVVQSDVSSDG